MAIKVLVTSTSFGKLVKEPVELLTEKGYQIIWRYRNFNNFSQLL